MKVLADVQGTGQNMGDLDAPILQPWPAKHQMIAEDRLDMPPEMFDDYSDHSPRGGTSAMALTGKDLLLVLVSVLLILVVMGVSS